MGIDELRQKRASLLGEMRTLADGEMDDEGVQAFDAKQAEVDELDKQIERLEKLEEQERSIEAPTTRAVKPSPVIAAKNRGDNEMRLWERWLRTGDEAIAREMRASNDTDMNVCTAADGGYAVPTGHYNQIIARRDEAALPMQVGVLRITGKGTTINVPVDNEADGEFVVTTEANAFDRDAPAINQVALTKLMYTKQIQLSYQLLQDEDSNLLTFISDFVGRGLAKTYNSLFITLSSR